MSTVVLPNTLGPGVVVAASIQANEQALADCINGNLDNTNIRTGAAIDINKLTASYEWLAVPVFAVGALGSAGYYGLVPMYNDGKGSWTVAAITWACPDMGAKTGTFAVEYGYYDAAGSWVVVAASDTMTITGTGAANTGGQGTVTLSSLTSLVLNATPRSLALRIVAGDATATNLYVTVHLKRQITAA